MAGTKGLYGTGQNGEGAYRGDAMRDGYWEDKDTAKMLTGHHDVRLGLPP